MLLSDFTRVWGFDRVSSLGSADDALAALLATARVELTGSPDAWATILSLSPSADSQSLDEFSGDLRTVSGDRGLLVVRRTKGLDFPFPALATTLAQAGFVVDTIAELEYDLYTAAIVVRRGQPSPVILPMIGPQQLRHPSEAMMREVTSAYLFERFLRHGSEDVLQNPPDEDHLAAALLRQETRLRSRVTEEITTLKTGLAETKAALRVERDELKRVKTSRSFLVGRVVAESLRRPSKAVRAARMLAKAQPSLPARTTSQEIIPEPQINVAAPSFDMLVRPIPTVGVGEPRVMMLASGARRAAWAEVATVFYPLPGEAMSTFERTNPHLVLIESSALLWGPWFGTGTGEDLNQASELLNLIDVAQACGVAVAYVWDVPFGSVAGAAQLARNADLQVAVSSDLASSVDEIIRPGFATNAAARAAFDLGKPNQKVLSTTEDVSLGDVEVDFEDVDALMRRREPTGHGMHWYGLEVPEFQIATMAARGVAIASPRNVLEVGGHRTPRSYRDLTQDERAETARQQMDDAWSNLARTQRHLFLSHSPQSELRDFRSLAPTIPVDEEAVAVLLVGGSVTASKVANWTAKQTIEPTLVVRLAPDEDEVVDPAAPLNSFASEEHLSRAIRAGRASRWLVVDASESGIFDNSDLCLDALRFGAYGFGTIGWLGNAGGRVGASMDRSLLLNLLATDPATMLAQIEDMRVDMDIPLVSAEV